MIRRTAAAISLATVVMSLQITTARASDEDARVHDEEVSAVVISSPFHPMTTTIGFDDPVHTPAAQQALSNIFGPVELSMLDADTAEAVVPGATLIEGSPLAPLSGEAGSDPEIQALADTGYGSNDIYCDASYSFNDSQGTFMVQRACGVRKAPWGFYLSRAMQDLCVSLVSEIGMKWWKNGVAQPRNASHFVPENYTFHGTFTGVGAGDTVRYDDDLYFRHNVMGGGDVHVHIFGTLNFKKHY